MRIMVLGVRGLPNVEGGVETHAEMLYPRLADRGCEIEVLVRSPFVPPGIQKSGALALRRLWSPTTAGAEAFVHSFLGVMYAAWHRPDVLHLHAVGPALVTPLARLFGLRVVVTHHGPDYDRDKWGPFARLVLRLGEHLGMRCCHACIAISPVIRDMVRAKHQRDCVVIPNGVPPASMQNETDVLLRLGATPGRYFLNVGRMVPEKRQLELIRAYAALGSTKWRLVLAGRLTDDDYCTEVRARATEAGVLLAGFVRGESLGQLYSHAGGFVLPSSHEGLPIALLEALSYGLPVIASDIPANVAVGLEDRCYFRSGDTAELAKCLQRLIDQQDDESARAARRAWVASRYDWDQIADQTLQVYRQVVTRRS